MNFEIKELTSEIKDLVTQIKKSQGCCCNQNVNEKLVNQLIELERLNMATFDDEAMVQERQQVKDQQSHMFISVACPTILGSN